MPSFTQLAIVRSESAEEVKITLSGRPRKCLYFCSLTKQEWGDQAVQSNQPLNAEGAQGGGEGDDPSSSVVSGAGEGQRGSEEQFDASSDGILGWLVTLEERPRIPGLVGALAKKYIGGRSGIRLPSIDIRGIRWSFTLIFFVRRGFCKTVTILFIILDENLSDT